MSLIDRAKNILLSPKTEWSKIDAEPATIGGLFTGYALLLALLPAIGALLGAFLFTGIAFQYIINGAIVGAIVAYVVSVGVVYLMGLIVAALAPSFDGQKDSVGAMKLVVYSATPVWVVGFFSQLLTVASWGLSFLLGLAAFGYAAYLLYLGCQAVIKVPQDKAAGFTIVTVLIWFVTYIVIAAILGMILFSLFVGSAIGTAAMYR